MQEVSQIFMLRNATSEGAFPTAPRSDVGFWAEMLDQPDETDATVLMTEGAMPPVMPVVMPLPVPMPMLRPNEGDLSASLVGDVGGDAGLAMVTNWVLRDPAPRLGSNAPSLGPINLSPDNAILFNMGQNHQSDLAQRPEFVAPIGSSKMPVVTQGAVSQLPQAPTSIRSIEQPQSLPPPIELGAMATETPSPMPPEIRGAPLEGGDIGPTLGLPEQARQEKVPQVQSVGSQPVPQDVALSETQPLPNMWGDSPFEGGTKIDPIQMRVSYPNLPPRQGATSALPVNALIGYRAPMPVPFDATPSTPLDLGDVAVTMPLIDDIQPERAKAAVMPPITPTGPVSDFELVVTQPEAAAPMVRPDTTARGAGEDAAPPLAGADRDLALAIDRSAPEYPPKFQTAAERAPNLPNVTRDAHDLIEPQDPPNGVYSGGQAASVVPNIAPLAAPSPLTVTSQAQPVFAAQIGAQIDRHIAATPIAPNSTGVTEFTLNPPELGRLRMVISNSEAGAMSLTILADCPEVADLMRRHSQILVQEFMREGLNHTAIKIEASAPAAQTATPTVPQASSGPQGLNLWADAHAQGQNPQRQNPQSHHNRQDRPVPDEPRSVVGAGVDARAIMVAAPIPTTRTLDLRL